MTTTEHMNVCILVNHPHRGDTSNTEYNQISNNGLRVCAFTTEGNKEQQVKIHFKDQCPPHHQYRIKLTIRIIGGDQQKGLQQIKPVGILLSDKDGAAEIQQKSNN